jgi:hypothetical protein
MLTPEELRDHISILSAEGTPWRVDQLAAHIEEQGKEIERLKNALAIAYSCATTAREVRAALDLNPEVGG